MSVIITILTNPLQIKSHAAESRLVSGHNQTIKTNLLSNNEFLIEQKQEFWLCRREEEERQDNPGQNTTRFFLLILTYLFYPYS